MVNNSAVPYLACSLPGLTLKFLLSRGSQSAMPRAAAASPTQEGGEGAEET